MVTSIDVNYGLFLKRLNQMGINTDLLDEKYGEKIKMVRLLTLTNMEWHMKVRY